MNDTAQPDRRHGERTRRRRPAGTPAPTATAPGTAGPGMSGVSGVTAPEPVFAPGRAHRPAPVPVLLYHAVHDDPPSWIAPYCVRPAVFARQLDMIADSGREPVGIPRLAQAVHGSRALPARPVVVTFDDGFADFADNALPALLARGLPVTLYVTTGALEPEAASPLPPADMLTWARLREVAAAPGVTIGAHGHTHRALDTLPAPVMRAEIAGPRSRIADELGRAPETFAHPHGHNDAAVREAVRRAGYTTGVAVRDAHSSALDDPWRIARLMVRADTPPELFAAWLDGGGAPVAPFPDRPRTLAWRAWRRARARLTGHPVPAARAGR